MNTFVIVHGAWAGGWFFQETARFLRAAGHEVYTPTLTGIGERVHLGHPDIDLDTHIQDIVNVLEYEDLEDVSLVGYSYGGMVVTGVAERVPERIKQLIYLDAFVPVDGQSLADIMVSMGQDMKDWNMGEQWGEEGAYNLLRVIAYNIKQTENSIREYRTVLARLGVDEP